MSDPTSQHDSTLHEVGKDMVIGGGVATGVGLAGAAAELGVVVANAGALPAAVAASDAAGAGGAAALGLAGLGVAAVAVGAGLLTYEAVTDGPLNEPLVAAGEKISETLDPVLDPVLSRVADAEDYVADAAGHAYDAVFGDDPGEQPPQ